MSIVLLLLCATAGLVTEKYSSIEMYDEYVAAIGTEGLSIHHGDRCILKDVRLEKE